ncbi:MAG: ATP-dependent RecD-like DNA helicase [Chitinivibrionales bacterium]|nr:ATP-dependent RecD-like DNA helicase [Chitinivibrionales bacterium]MBD3395066.1 ATP-dependent RecD-like DNA helicase [Chitinivibrionales bacterium]
MIEIQGIVTDVTYQNEDTGFTVLRLHDEERVQPRTCVGTMPTVRKGESVLVRGEQVNDPRYGPQLRVSSYELARPVTLDGMRMLLSSGLIANIGPHRAQKIIDTFGTGTLDILDREPKRLLQVSGIGKKTLANIVDAWKKQQHVRDLMLFLQQFGVSVNLAQKIYRAYGGTAKEVVSTNPYALIDDIWGVGFKKADAIARHLGFGADSYRRIKAGLIFIMQEAVGDGHCFLPRQEAINKAAELLGVPLEMVLYSLDHVVQEKVLVLEKDSLYLPAYHRAEITVADLLHKRVSASRAGGSGGDHADIEAWLERYRRLSSWEPDPRQVEAVKAAITNRIFLLTGGPGTGKTTTLQVIVAFYRERSVPVALAAPTGRAAQRMGTISGIAAKTIHRLLEFHPRGRGHSFARNADNPLDAKVIIVDEVSMIDLMLMRNLLDAVPPDATLIFVGDSNQLPSVGAGNVLADMIASGAISHVRLTTIFRQAAQSRIVTAAHEIIEGAVPYFANVPSEDCFFMKKEEPDACVHTILDLVTGRLPRRYGLDAIRDIQVLSPMHKGPIGTQALNRLLQKHLNPSPRALIRGETSFAEGDKVMQIRNNYDKGVFNGDIGFVTSLSGESELSVDFGEHSIHYDHAALDELTHAYCISIHKSQGCEFKAVVIPLMTHHYILLQRNLLYTALTRARQLCVMVGMPKALALAVNNDTSLRRYSWLADRIRA